MKYFAQVAGAMRMIFDDGRKSIFTFSLLSAAFFATMFFLPVVYTIGNSAGFQAGLYTPGEYLLLAALSILSGLVLTIQWRIFSDGVLANSRGRVAGEAALGGAGILGGIVSSLFATASCGFCVGAIFSFLGFGGVLFLVERRWYILGLAFLLLLTSLHFSLKRLASGCQSCAV